LTPELPAVPLTIEGASALHQIFRIRWSALRALPANGRAEVIRETAAILTAMEAREPGCQSAAYSMLGHKGDLMLVHFRKDFEALQAAQVGVARLALAAFLEPTTSYVSILELGMYEMTAQIHARLAEKGLKNGSAEFEGAFAAELEEQRRRVAGRLFLEVPKRRYVCFYPMNKRRGEDKNWYAVPVEERARMMRDHGVIGRHYAGQVTQVISGAIGFDDWEWGVDLFADDPLVFKKLIYEMRFDEASAWYAEFGPFYTGLQFSAAELPRLLDGHVPALLG
jgi:chlorite dismutase